MGIMEAGANGDRLECNKCPYRIIVSDPYIAPCAWHNECSYDGENYTKGTPKCEAYYDPTERGTKEANARLIAAAPELLDACEKILHASAGEINDVYTIFKNARAAIAKAKGETCQ